MTKETVRDEILQELRIHLADELMKKAVELEACDQEGCLAALQLAGTTLASYGGFNPPKGHGDILTWGMRNLTGIYAQIFGIESQVVIHDSLDARAIDKTVN